MTALHILYGIMAAIAAGTATGMAIVIARWLRSGASLPRTEAGDVDHTALSIGVIPMVAVATLALVGRLI